MSKVAEIVSISFLFLSLSPTVRAQSPLTAAGVEAWLDRYGAAWEARDPDAARALFAPDARYYETPYAEPFLGRAGIRDYWATVTSDQRDVEFRSSVVSVSGSTGVAHWTAKFMSVSEGVEVELDGIFVLEFDAEGRVAVLREWWHAR